jgi:glutamyl-tRNA reductase
MSVFAVGLNHASAPLALRERLAFSADALKAPLTRLQRHLGGGEAALLSTCNRTEVYVAGPAELAQPTLHHLAELAGMNEAALRPHTYLHRHGDAARHAFRVAAGLDSMVLGEPQILGQLKHAVREAGDAGTLGSTLHQLFQRGFAVAKEVRTSTEIGAHSISMAAAAVRLAAELFEDLSETRVLFVGAGEMIELAATHFAARNPKALVVANRTPERGAHLAARFGGQSIALGDLSQRLGEFDIVVSCTASSLPLIGLGAVERALKARKRRPMFMVDLAVPRDIEPEVAKLSDVYLYTVDDLSQRVQTAGEKRQAAVAQAEAIVETGVQGFVHWLDQRQSVPLIQALQAQMADWRHTGLQRARKHLAKGEPPEAVLEGYAQQVEHKLLHGLLAELHSTHGPARAELEALLQRLFLRGR